MSTNRIEDPALKAFEDQLAGLAPQISLTEQQDLLYQCAFAAGKQAMNGSLRRWQAAVATLAVLLGCVCLPLANSQWTVARHEPQPGPVPSPTPTPQQIVVREPVSDSVRPVVPAARFDAWQVALSSSDAIASNLAQLEQIEPATRPLAVTALTRAALQQ